MFGERMRPVFSVLAATSLLSAQGIETGNIDGAWGEDTKRGVKEFQRKHNLEQTGTLTLPTLAALGIDVKHDARQAIAND